jgi:hypothetical protein
MNDVRKPDPQHQQNNPNQGGQHQGGQKSGQQGGQHNR